MRWILLLSALSLSMAWPQEDQEWVVALEPARSASVCALIAGQVVRLAVQEGARVTAGDTLVWLADEELRLTEAEAQLTCERAQRFLDRVLQLHHRALLSAQELEEAQYQAQAARLRLQRAQLELSRAWITAPLSGQVADLQVQVGNLISPRQPLCQLLVTEDLKVALFLPADQVATLQVPQRVTGQVIATGQRLEGRLVRLSPVVDVQSGRCRAEILFPGAGRKLKPGTVVRVHLPTPQPLPGGKER